MGVSALPSRRSGGTGSVFDHFRWWDEGDVLTQITPIRFAYIRSTAGELQGRRVLDLGCGGGLISEPLCRAGARVIGIDISGNALRAARDHAAGNGLAINYLLSPAELLPFAGGSFDTVVAFDVLEHLYDLARAISEISRVLKPGGRLIYDTMNRTLPCRIAVIWIGESLWPGGPPKGTHDWNKLIRPEELMSLLRANGIANVETRGFMPVGVDLRGKLLMSYAPCKQFSYVGYGVKRV